MNVIRSLRCSLTRLFAISVLSLTGHVASAVPIQPGLLFDPQFQACLDETALVNGWTLTEEVTSLKCSSRNINNIDGIQILNNLIELDISDNRISVLFGLDLLPQMQILNLGDNHLFDILPLQALNSLTQLNIGGNTQLQRLDVQSVIQTNPGLTHIGVAGIAMGDLSWLPPVGPAGEFDLIELDIGHIGSFPDLFPLIQYANLAVIRAAGNNLQSASPVDQLLFLDVLDLSDNQLIDIQPVIFLNGLSQLNLSGNSRLDRFSVEQVVQANAGLTHIGVADITMGDLNWLPPFGPSADNLIELDISRTGTLPDLFQLAQYVNLRVLRAAGNQTQNLGPIEQLLQLDVLDLSDNQLIDVFPLQFLQGLSQLNLSENKQLDPFAVQQVIQSNPGLTHIGVAGIAMGDLNWLPPVGPTGEFNIVELDISRTGPLLDLFPLVQYANLQVLKASGNQLQFPGPIDQLTQLDVLDLSNNRLIDVFELQFLQGLSQINLSENRQLDPFIVQQVILSNPGLTHIGVAGIAMGDLNWLPPVGPAGENNLVELDISRIGTLPDLFTLAQYTSLRVLKAAGNQILSLGGIDQLVQLDVLDLSENQLIDIFSLQFLQGLSELNLSENTRLNNFDVQQVVQSNPGLTHLAVAGITMGDLNWLPPIGFLGEFNFIELDISRTGSFSNLIQLGQYANLRVLKTAGNQIQDLAGIEQLLQLDVLDLSDNQIVFAFALPSLQGLSELYLNNNSQLDPFIVQQTVQSNPGLTHIGVAGIAMGDLNWLPPIGLQGEFNFIELDISRIGVLPDLFQLAQYTNLQVLKATGNQLQNLGPIEQLLQLDVLDLSDNQLIDVFSLQFLQGLSQLNLSGNKKLDPFIVQQIILANPGLTHISIAEIPMLDLFWLPPFGPTGEFNLLELDISYTGAYFDLAPVNNYPNLRVLKAAGNQLQFAFPLEQLIRLEVLDLSDNQLTDVSSLTVLNQLTQLNLNGNNLLDSFTVQQIVFSNPGLTHIGVAGISMFDLYWLPPIGPMGEYDLIELDISNTGSYLDLLPLNNYPNLRVLKAAGNQIQFAYPLDQLLQLEILDLSNNRLNDIFALSLLNNLTQLNLGGNHQLDPFMVQQIIQQNPHLTHIGVADIAMGDLSWLPPVGPQGEFSLLELDISRIGTLPDLFPLSQYQNLRVLKASGNQLQFAGGLEPLLQLDVLDLSDNQLFDIFPLTGLNQLTQLNLNGNNQLDPLLVQQVILANPGLTHIGVSGIYMGDLSWLPPLGFSGEFNLLELDVSYTGTFPDLFAVAQYPNLRVLNASGNKLQSVAGIEPLIGLEVLDLSDNQLIDVYSLQFLQGLKQINLSGNQFVFSFDVENIVLANPGLTHISVAGISMGNLNWLPPVGLQGEYNIQELDISSTGVFSDLSILSQYTNLKVLKAANNGIQTLWFFGDLPSLEVVDLSDNRLFDIESLKALTHLRELYLSNNILPDPFAPGVDLFSVNQVIDANQGLTHLGVAGVYLGFLDQLSIFAPGVSERMLELDVSNTGLLDLNAAASLINLRVLKAAGNLVTDIFPLTQLLQLETLDLSDNDLQLVLPLGGLPNLKLLDLSGNNHIQCSELDQLQAQLQLINAQLIRPVSCLVLSPPTIAILSSPNTSSNYETSPVILTASATDVEDGNLDASIQWSSDLDGYLGAGSTISAYLTAGNHVITAVITDSNNNLSSTTVNLTVLANTAPALLIQALVNGGLFNEGDVITLAADANDAEEGIISAGIQWSSDTDGVIGLGAVINPVLSVGAHVIKASVTDKAGAVTTQSVSLVVNGLPQLTLQSPLKGGLFQQGDSLVFSAVSTDSEDGDLSAGVNWVSSIDGVIGTGAQFTYVLSVGTHTITASVSDAAGAIATQTLSVTVNGLPQLSLVAPVSGTLYQQGDSVNLAATASDIEDGVLSANISWTSSLDGALGTGAQLTNVLSVGAHTITASITDSAGATASQTSTVSVNGLPQLNLLTPLSGSVFQQGESVTLSATASDIEDGILSASVTWTSSLDGVLGTGAQLTKVLSVGKHTITASITDSAGASTTQSSTLSVNSQPLVTLQSPLSGSLFMLQESVNLSAAANDLEDGNISPLIQWTSNLDGALGTGAALTTNLSLGTHTLTASVTDSAGGVHSVTTQIVIEQIDLAVAVSGNGSRKFATLTWSGSRTDVDIYKNGNLRRTGGADGTTVLRFRNQATFKVCETGTVNCSVDVVVTAN